MKRGISYILITCYLCSLLSACQPTPEKAVVVNKNDFEGKIQQSEAPAEKYIAPKSWKEIILTENGFFIVVIDANITIPDATDFPVVVIEPMQISSEIEGYVERYRY